MEVEQELYLGILIDGSVGGPVVIASRAGGMEIEEIATESPELILRVAIDPVVGFQPFQSRYLSRAMGLNADAAKALTPQLTALYRLFMERGLLHGGGQPAGGDERTADYGPGRQGHYRRQRPLPPAADG